MSIEKVADLILGQALKHNASDIHIIPRSSDYLVQFRLYGRLSPHRNIPVPIGERLIAHFKFVALMDISEKRRPQSGAFQLEIHEQLIALRISTLPTSTSKESLVIRILPQKNSLTVKQISLFPSISKKLISLLMYSHGMIIFTGPTGSGKTTTMYTLVEHCAKELKRNVITLEDPVEKQSEQFLQVQVNEKAGITYSSGLKAILRHDPDIILVGEIRDAETAKIAVRAALTGHLVLTTLHARDARGAIYRLLEFGVKWYEIEQTVIAASAQRLVTMLCPFCGEHCSSFCPNKRRGKRTAVYELLHGTALKYVIKEANGETIHYHYPTLKEYLRKGIALGYISKNEFERWIHEMEKTEAP